MIKVLQYGLNPTCGGIEKSLDRIWSNIDKDSFRFDFIDEWNGRVCFKEKFEGLGSTFYNIPSRRESVKKNIRAWKSIPADEFPDVLHCHMNTLSYVYPVFWAINRNIPVILHSRSSGMKGSSFTYVLHTINQLRLKGKQINRVAVSNKAGKWLFGDEASYLVIHNGIDEKKYSYSEQCRNLIRKELQIDDDTCLIGAVGHLSEEKNIPFMLDIIEDLCKKNINCKLMIIGDGILKNQAVELINNKNIANQVLLLGYIVEPEKYYSAMDVYVMPSLREGFPNAALEAQANGLKCLMSDTITREVDAGLCLYLPISMGTESWVSAITDCMESNGTNRKCARKIDDFSVEKEIADYKELYLHVYKKNKVMGV